MELIDLENSAIIFLSQTILLRWLTFLLGSLTVTLSILLFWICLFILMLVFVLQWLYLHRETQIMLLPQVLWTFIQTQRGCPFSSHSLWLFLCWLRWSWLSFERCSLGSERMSLILLLLLLVLNFVSGSKLELMYVSLIVIIRSGLIYPHGFQLPVLVP